MYSGILNEPHFESDQHVAVTVIELTVIRTYKTELHLGGRGRKGNIDLDLILKCCQWQWVT